MLSSDPVSPKSQLHAVGLPVEPSVKVTVSGEGPERGVPPKSATGGATTVTYPVFVAVFGPPALLAVSFTVKVPTLL